MFKSLVISEKRTAPYTSDKLLKYEYSYTMYIFGKKHICLLYHIIIRQTFYFTDVKDIF